MQLQSRSGRLLTGYFPEVARIARDHLPPGVVLDGEVIVWEGERRRLSFAHLQRRITASPRRALELALQHPAHLVAFDVLQFEDQDLRGRPLRERRRILERLLAGAPPQLTPCPQTTSREQAQEWFYSWPAIGVEGLVIKDLDGVYQPGRRGWRKIRRRSTTPAIIAGVTGRLTAPETLLLGRYGPDERLRYVGRTRPLTPLQQRELAEWLRPPRTGRQRGATHPWPRPLPAGWLGQLGSRDALDYVQVEPDQVADVDVDTAYEHDRWRHSPVYQRIRRDLSIFDVPLTTQEP